VEDLSRPNPITKELICSARTESQGFSELWKRMRIRLNPVLARAFDFRGILSKEDFEAIAMAEVWRALANYSPRRNVSFVTVAYQYVRNRFLKEVKGFSRQKRNEVGTISLDEAISNVVPVARDPMVDYEFHDYVKVILNKLGSEEVRMIFGLRLNGYSFEEIEKELHLRPYMGKYGKKPGKKAYRRLKGPLLKVISSISESEKKSFDKTSIRGIILDEGTSFKTKEVKQVDSKKAALFGPRTGSAVIAGTEKKEPIQGEEKMKDLQAGEGAAPAASHSEPKKPVAKKAAVKKAPVAKKPVAKKTAKAKPAPGENPFRETSALHKAFGIVKAGGTTETMINAMEKSGAETDNAAARIRSCISKMKKRGWKFTKNEDSGKLTVVFGK